MLGLGPPRPHEGSRRRASRKLFECHKYERTADGRADQLLRAWLSSKQRTELSEKGYFEVIGGSSGKQYRIYSGSAMNVFEVDDIGQPCRGVCFMPRGKLPASDIMLAQKIALESSEEEVLGVARLFSTALFSFSSEH